MRRPFVKRYIEERELTVMLAVDLSGSERFGTVRRFKSELASELAAVLAMSAVRNNDRVGIVLFTDRIEYVLPPRKGRRRHLVVQVVWRGVVDDVNVRVIEQSLVTTVAFARSERFCLRPSRFIGAAGNCDDIDEPKAPDGVDVMRPDEPCPYQPHADAIHPVSGLRARAPSPSVLALLCDYFPTMCFESRSLSVQ
jgi:hypothetical protein